MRNVELADSNLKHCCIHPKRPDARFSTRPATCLQQTSTRYRGRDTDALAHLTIDSGQLRIHHGDLRTITRQRSDHGHAPITHIVLPTSRI